MWDLTQIQQVLNQLYGPVIADQLNQQTVTLGMLPKSIGEGKNIAFPVKLVRGTSAGSYASGADISGNDNDTEQPAVLQWKRYKAEFKVTGEVIAAAASNMGQPAYANMLGKVIMDATKNLGKKLNTDIFGDGTGNGGLDLDGLAVALADSGTYAGLSRSTYPLWRGNVLANGGTARALTVDLMRVAERLVFENSGAMPDLIVTSPRIHDKFEALFDNLKRFPGDVANPRIEGSTMGLFFRGIPIVRDAQCPAGQMFFITRDSLSFEQLMPVDMLDGIELVQGRKPIMNDSGDIGMQVAIEMLGKTGDAYKGFVKLYGNLKVEHPNRNAVIKDIDEA